MGIKSDLMNIQLSNYELTRIVVGERLMLRWFVPIYMRVGYVFDSRFSEGKIQPISMIFGILNK